MSNSPVEYVKLVAPVALLIATIAIAALSVGLIFRRQLANHLRQISSVSDALDGLSVACFLAGSQILILLASLDVVAGVGFLMGFSAGSWVAPLAFAASSGAGVLVAWKVTKSRIFAGVLVALVAIMTIASLWAAGLFFDLSNDGQWYHEAAVIDMAHGWNPARTWMDPADSTIPSWVSVYPKSAWMEDEAFYETTGRIETSKAGNILLLLSAFLLSFSVLLRIEPRKPLLAGLGAGVLVLNPVTVLQLFTFMVDGRIASLFLCSLALGAALLLDSDRLPVLVPLGCSLMMLGTSKFPGLASAVILGVVLLVVVAVNRPTRRVFGRVLASMVVALVITVLLVGFNPYVTNTLMHGSPAYPLAGKGAVTLFEAPEAFRGLSSITMLLYSTFARSADYVRFKSIELKVPFSVSMDELRSFSGGEGWIGGLGPLFGGALLLSLLLAIWLGSDRSARASGQVRVAATFAAATLVTVLINPAAYIARLAPQMWLIPALICVAALYHFADRGVTRVLPGVLAAVLLVNVMLVGVADLAYLRFGTLAVNTALSDLQKKPETVLDVWSTVDMRTTLRTRLAERGLKVRLRLVDDWNQRPDLAQAAYFPYSTARFDKP